MIDDKIVISLARAMPKLEVRQLGRAPCTTVTYPGVTVNGLIGLARHCPHLSKLRIHFQGASLVDVATGETIPSRPGGEPVVQRWDCALTDLDVGATPIPSMSTWPVALMLLKIFPRILNIGYRTYGWKTVAEAIMQYRQIDAFVHRSSKPHLSHSMILSDAIPGDATGVGRPSEDGQA